MAFKAGAIYGEARLDTKKWKSGLGSLKKMAAVAMAAVATAVVVYMTKAVKAANIFQKSMSNVATLLDETKVSTVKLTKEILKLDPALGSTTELTNGLYQAFSAGAKTAEEAMQITVDAAKFAKAGLTDTNTAVDVLTTAVNAYGRETMNTTKASDIFFTTIKQGKITGEQLASSIGQVIPLFAATGIELEELTAGMAAMTKQGINAQVATTQLRGIVNAFLKPSEALNKLLEEQGFASGSALLESEGLAGALKLLEEATDGDATALAELLPNIRALSGTMALTGVGGEEFNAILKEMETSAGATEVAFGKQEKTFDTLKNSLDRGQIILGNIGKFFVDKVAAGATTAANSMTDFIMSNRGMEIVAQIAGYVAGGFTLIKETIMILWEVAKKSFIPVFDNIKEVFKEIVGETNQGAGAMKIFSIVVNIVSSAIIVLGKMIQGGIGILRDWIIAIKESAGVVGTFFKFLKGEAKWEEVKKQGESAVKAFDAIGKNYVENIKEVFETVRDEIKTFSGETEEITTTLTAKVTTAYQGASFKIKSTWDEMLTGQTESTEYAVNDLTDTIVTGNDTIVDDTRNAAEIIRTSWARVNLALIYDFWSKDKTVKKSAEESLAAVLSLKKNFTEEVYFKNLEMKNNEKETVEELVVTWQDYFNAITGGVKTLFNTYASTQTEFFKASKNELSLKHQGELTALQERFDNGLISEQEYNDSKTELEKEQKAEVNELEEKAFKANKKNRIGSIWIDLASSIMGWWAQAPKLGPIAGPIFAGVMTGASTAAAIAQSAAIVKQKFVPAKVAGGMTGGLTRVNEQGGEIITLPDNSQVIPNDISRQIANSVDKQGTIINVSFDGAKISDEMDLENITDHVIRKLGKEMRLVG